MSLCILLGNLDEVGNLLQERGYIVVLDDDTLWEVKWRGGKVEHTLDTCVDDRYNQRRGHRRGRRDDDDAYVELIDKLLELVDMVAGDVVDGSAHLLAIYIEGGGNT